MQARREGLVKKTDEHVIDEDKPEQASAEYTAWRTRKIKTFLADTIDTHATDHSTIMTNPMHAKKALAYDVAVGHCHIRDKDLHALRVAADWRFLAGLDDGDPNKVFSEYFLYGVFNKLSALDWAHADNSEGRMPDKIVDQRENPPPRPHAHPHPRGST